MIVISTNSEVENIIKKEPAVLLYFSGESCSVCKVLKPKIEQELSRSFPKIRVYEIRADLSKELASKFSVFSIPTILVFFDSKEFFRFGRNISISKFVEDIKRPYDLFVEGE